MDTTGFAIIAAGVLIFALISGRLQNSIVTGPMIFAAFGFLIGGAVLDIAPLEFGHGFVHGLAEVTLIFVLFSDAARIDLREVRSQNIPFRMLVIGMPLAILAGTLVGWWLPLGLGIWQAALLAAVLAPTDAALGQSVISNPGIPVRIRQALNIESGLNDGIALPVILLLAAIVAGGDHAPGTEFLGFVAAQLILGPIVGLVVGFVGAWALDKAALYDWMDMAAEGAAILALAFLSFAAAEMIDGNGFIAAFVAGLVFGNRVRNRCTFLFEFIEAEGQLLVLLTFLIFGGAILPEIIGNVTWEIAIYAILSLTFIRMIPIALSLLGTGLRTPTYIFLGWFGPRGLASILFALLVLEELSNPVADTITLVTIVTVAISIIAHGISAAPAAKWYARLAEDAGECEEKSPVTELPTRTGMVADDMKSNQ